jgi:hypothetical protein
VKVAGRLFRIAPAATLAACLLATGLAPAAADVSVASELHGPYDACIAKFRAVGHPEEVDELDNNHRHKTTIKKVPNTVQGGHSTRTQTDDKASRMPPGADATILWDPDGSGPFTGDPGVSEDACATLFHEMNHANDDETGQNYNYSNCVTKQPDGTMIDSGISIAEVNATRAENIYRAAVNAALDKAAASGQPPPAALAGQARLPLRTTYYSEKTGKWETLPLFAADPVGNPDAKGCEPPPPPPQPPGGGGCSVSAPGLSAAHVSGDDASCGVSNGDPHLTTFDQVHYDFQAVGEFLVTKADTGDLEVQSRQTAFPNTTDVSVNTAAAMNVADDRVGVYLTDSGAVIRINHAVARLSGDFVRLPHGGVVSRLGDGSVAVTWPDGSQALVSQIGRWGFLLSLHLADARRGHVQGLLGNFDGKPDNDLVLRRGGSIGKPIFGNLYPRFADSWRISQQESLFDYGPGQSTAAFTDRKFPSKTVSAVDLPNRAIAAAICGQAGVTDPQVLADCILDVGMTGQVDFARSAAQSQVRYVGSGPPGGTGSTPQSLVFSGPIAGTLLVARAACSSPSPGRYEVSLEGDLGGRRASIGITVIRSYHGAGTYAIGDILDNVGQVILAAGSYVAATSEGAGTLTVNADQRSGALDVNLSDGTPNVERMTGTWSCSTPAVP